MARRVPTPWRADLYVRLFDRAFAKDCDPEERAHAVAVMRDLVDGRRVQGEMKDRLLGELIRVVLAERLDPE